MYCKIMDEWWVEGAIWRLYKCGGLSDFDPLLLELRVLRFAEPDTKQTLVDAFLQVVFNTWDSFFRIFLIIVTQNVNYKILNIECLEVSTWMVGWGGESSKL